MNMSEIKQKDSLKMKDDRRERGSALVIAVFVLVLISVFVAMALSRTSSEAAAVGNETSEGRTFYAAQGSLELMTRNFNKVFETKINPSNADLNAVRYGIEPGLTQYDFDREVDQVSDSEFTVLNTGDYAGLYATRDTWRLRTTVTDPNGVQIRLARNILNNRIPIFQFGIFYNDDLEFHPGPRFDFGGRVHSNGSLFMMAQTGLWFSSKVSTAGEIVTDIARNGKSYTNWGEKVYIKTGAGDVQLLHNLGSVLTSPTNGIPVFDDPVNKPKLFNPDMPTVYTRSDWATTHKIKFGGNLLANQNRLDLPLKITTAANATPLDYIELIKRGVPGDSEVTTSERYFNKTGIRISLSDNKAQLPGCADDAVECGKRLDGDAAGNSQAAIPAGDARGYQPVAMADGYQGTRLNGERFGTFNGDKTTRQMWIKIELVSKDDTTNAIITQDVTADILSLGVTEPAPCMYGKFGILTPGYYTVCDGINTPVANIDSRSVIKLQRFVMPGANFLETNSPYMTNFATWGGSYSSYNIVHSENCNNIHPITGKYIGCQKVDDGFDDHDDHKINAVVDDPLKLRRIVPFPIEMFDSREGVYNADTSVLNTTAVYGNKVPWAGVMSIIDVDVKNLKRFLDGEHNTKMPTGTNYYNSVTPNHVLRSSLTDPTQNDVPQTNGWVVYVSDRRGDNDNDGEYDMEDIYGGNDGFLQKGEDVNISGALDTNYSINSTKFTTEAVKYKADGLFNPGSKVTADDFNFSSSFVLPSIAASIDHRYYRRAVRLINGETLPGVYDSANSDNTRGFTVASENGVYVQGNYNASSIDSVGTPTPYDQYNPFDTTDHIPASIVADAITVLSNYAPLSANKDGWLDSKSFRYPFGSASNQRKASETFTRFAILSGDAQSSYEALPNQGGSDPRLGGGVHNFKRFLEDWSGVRLNYCGSLINLYNARNNNGAFKSSGVVYSPPNRNWVFDETFLDPARLPPGTPYFQYVQTTGFERTNN